MQVIQCRIVEVLRDIGLTLKGMDPRHKLFLHLLHNQALDVTNFMTMVLPTLSLILKAKSSK